MNQFSGKHWDGECPEVTCFMRWRGNGFLIRTWGSKTLGSWREHRKGLILNQLHSGKPPGTLGWSCRVVLVVKVLFKKPWCGFTELPLRDLCGLWCIYTWSLSQRSFKTKVLLQHISHAPSWYFQVPEGHLHGIYHRCITLSMLQTNSLVFTLLNPQRLYKVSTKVTFERAWKLSSEFCKKPEDGRSQVKKKTVQMSWGREELDVFIR